jgi:predicted RNA-binding Zn-ribbon protein involved in translation (DUF1610 family)
MKAIKDKNIKDIELRCSKCGWRPYPGSIINYDSIKYPPYYCPNCGEIITIKIIKFYKKRQKQPTKPPKPPNFITRLHILGKYLLFYFYKFLIYIYKIGVKKGFYGNKNI